MGRRAVVAVRGDLLCVNATPHARARTRTHRRTHARRLLGTDFVRASATASTAECCCCCTLHEKPTTPLPAVALIRTQSSRSPAGSLSFFSSFRLFLLYYYIVSRSSRRRFWLSTRRFNFFFFFLRCRSARFVAIYAREPHAPYLLIVVSYCYHTI